MTTKPSELCTHGSGDERSLYLASLIDNISDALIGTDMDFNILEWNAAAESMYGWAAAEVIGQPLQKFIQTEYTDNTDEVAQKVILEQGIWKGEVTQKRKDGTRIPLMASVSVVKHETGKSIGFVAINRDITERKLAEEELRKSEEKYRFLFENNPHPMWIYDLRTLAFLAVNDAVIEKYGYTRDEFLHMTIAEIRPTEDISRLRDDLAKQRPTLKHSGQWRHLLKNGTVIDVEITTHTLHIGENDSILVVAQDITERKHIEEILKRSEIRYRRLFESAKDGILILDAETGMIVDVNPFLITLLGYSKEAFLGKNIWELGFFNDIIANKANFLELQQKQYIRYEDLPLKTAYGRQINVEFVSNVYEVHHDKVIQCNIRDITERKRSEEKIQRQLEHLNSLRTVDMAISSSFDIHVTLDVALQQAISQLGVDAAAILLFNPYDQTIEYAASRGLPPNVIQHTKLKLGEGFAGRVVLERRTVQTLDLMATGGELAKAFHLANENFVDYYGTPLIVKGEVKGVLEIYHRSPINLGPDRLDFLETLAGQAAIAIDNAQLFESLQRSNAELEQRVDQRTGELNRTNAELEHANRVKDEFLATMSHELRTPLNSILGLSESLLEQRRDPLSAYQQRSLKIIESSGSHLLELINDILDLSKIEAGKFDYYPQIIAVDDLCHASLAFVKEQATRKSILLTYQQEAAASKIYADPRRLKQILVNLLTNAVKFTPDQGHVILQVRDDVEQDRIQFSVIDTGIGIALEDLKLLFLPFAQVDSSLTREHEGTGLGLALVRKLADLHGGSVNVESEVGKGSRFTVNLPVGQAIIAQQAVVESGSKLPDNEQAIPSPQPADRGIILLAEDNMANVLTIGDYLESHGYQVVVAHDGLEAIEKAGEIQPNIILMDVQMPALDGLEAIRRLRMLPRFKTTPIIALTALAMPGDRERCLAAGANEYMSKPVSLKGLAKTIKQLLEQPI